MTTKIIQNEIYPAFGVLNQMVRNGTLMLPSQVSYALGKNLSKIKKILKAWEDFRNDSIKLHVKMVNNVPQTVETEKKTQEWDFLSPESRKKFISAMDEYLDAEIAIEGGWRKISEEHLKEVHNFPMDVFAAFEEAGILTSIMLESKGLKVIN
jgi:hypothetical protein